LPELPEYNLNLNVKFLFHDDKQELSSSQPIGLPFVLDSGLKTGNLMLVDS
jgi:hypothetical protein